MCMSCFINRLGGKEMSKLGKQIKKNWQLIFIMLVALFSRSVLLGKIPCGVHADEAYAGYEAYSLLKYGTDSWEIGRAHV